MTREAQGEILQLYANGLVSEEQAERMLDALQSRPTVRTGRGQRPVHEQASPHRTVA